MKSLGFISLIGHCRRFLLLVMLDHLYFDSILSSCAFINESSHFVDCCFSHICAAVAMLHNLNGRGGRVFDRLCQSQNVSEALCGETLKTIR